MATTPQHWRPLSHSVWCPSRPVTGARARDSDTTSTLSSDAAEIGGDFRPHPPSPARSTQLLCAYVVRRRVGPWALACRGALAARRADIMSSLCVVLVPLACDARPGVDRTAACAGAATAEALAQQCHRFRLSVGVHSVQARRLPTSLASVYATATLPPELPGVSCSSTWIRPLMTSLPLWPTRSCNQHFHERLTTAHAPRSSPSLKAPQSQQFALICTASLPVWYALPVGACLGSSSHEAQVSSGTAYSSWHSAGT